jgi:hypothetical protein
MSANILYRWHINSSSQAVLFYETEGQQVKVVRSFRPMGGNFFINYSYNSKGQLIEWKRSLVSRRLISQRIKQTFEYYPMEM